MLMHGFRMAEEPSSAPPGEEAIGMYATASHPLGPWTVQESNALYNGQVAALLCDDQCFDYLG